MHNRLAEVRERAIHRNVQARFCGFSKDVARAYWSLFDHDGIQPGDAKFARRLLAEWPDGIDIRDMAGQDPTDDVSLSKDESAIAAWAESILRYHALVESIFDGGRLLPLNGAGDWKFADRVSALEREIEVLERRNAGFLADLDKLDDSMHHLEHKRKTSIYRLVLGLAVKKFNYSHGKNNSASKNIHKVIEKSQYEVKKETILDILRDAYEFLNPDDAEDKETSKEVSPSSGV